MENRRDFVTRMAALAAAAVVHRSIGEKATVSLDAAFPPHGSPLFGFAVNQWYDNRPGYQKTWDLMTPGGIATPESSFSEKNVAPTATSIRDIAWNLAPPKAQVAKAKSRGVVFKGSLWSGDNPGAKVSPPWYGSVITSWASAQAVINAFCEEMVAPFGTDVSYWNVWNETLKPWGRAYGHVGYMDNPFLKYGGVDYRTGYIAYGLTQVHAAAPHAKLLLNFGRCETFAAQRANILALVIGLKDAGIPLDLIGSEHHCLASEAGSLAQQKQAVIDWAGQLAEHGVGFAVTEFDVIDDTVGAPADRDALHATMTETVLSTAMAIPTTDHFQCWALADPWSWYNHGYGPQTMNKPQRSCWLDSNLAPTPAYALARKYFPKLPPAP